MTRNRRADRGAAIGDGMAWLARWSLRLALVTLGAYLLWQVIAMLWVIVLPVLLALLITTVLWPPAKWMREHGVPPAVAAMLVVLGGLGLLALIITLVTTSFVGGIPEIANNATDAIDRIRQWLSGPPLNLAQSDLDGYIQQGADRLQQSVGSIASGLLAGASAVTSGIVAGVLALVLAFLFVKDGPQFTPWLRGVVGERAGVHVTVVLSRVWATLGGFIRVQVVVSLIDAVFIGIGLVIVGVPLALPLAVLTFLGGFIPIVGAFVAGVLAVLVALVSNGLTAALIVLGIIIAVQQIEGNVLQPLMQGRSLRLHAAVVLLAVTAGSSIYGIAGAFLAVPVVATAAVVLRYLGELVDERTEPDTSSELEPVPATGALREDALATALAEVDPSLAPGGARRRQPTTGEGPDEATDGADRAGGPADGGPGRGPEGGRPGRAPADGRPPDAPSGAHRAEGDADGDAAPDPESGRSGDTPRADAPADGQPGPRP